MGWGGGSSPVGILLFLGRILGEGGEGGCFVGGGRWGDVGFGTWLAFLRGNIENNR